MMHPLKWLADETQNPNPRVEEKWIRSWTEAWERTFVFKRRSEWRPASSLLKGTARTGRRAPAVKAVLKQTPSPVRGLSLGLWEWDWTVQHCWKILHKHLYCECSRWLRLEPVCVRGKIPSHWSCLQETFCFLLLLRCRYLISVDHCG